MSRHPRDRRHSEDHLENLVAEALRDMGETIPTTEEEVARAEAELGALSEAPPRVEPGEALAATPPRGRDPRAADASAPGTPSTGGLGLDAEESRAKGVPVDDGGEGAQAPRRAGAMAPPASLAERRSSRVGLWFSHAGTAALGALAAGFMFLWLRPSSPPPIVLAPGGGHSAVGGAIESRVPPPETRLSLSAVCSDCCAGSSCTSKPTACASGKQCVSCSMEGQGRFRFRLGAVRFVDTKVGEELTQAGLQLCLAVAKGKPICVPANRYTEESEPWRVLPPVISAQDLLSGVEFGIRSAGATAPVATWRRPVALGAEILCSGLYVAFQDEKGEPVGSLSAFLDDAQFVEVKRGPTPAPLATLARALGSATVRPLVHETTATGDRRFALVIGPLGVDAANRVRWQLLDKGYTPTFTTGSDLLAPARPTEGP